MARVRIVHWNAVEAVPLLDACRAAGHEVEYEPADLPATARKIRQTLPEALEYVWQGYQSQSAK